MLTHTFPPVSVICSLPSLQQADNLLFPFALYHNFTISAPLTINNSQYLLLLLLFSEYLQYIYIFFFCVSSEVTLFSDCFECWRSLVKSLQFWEAVEIPPRIPSHSFEYSSITSNSPALQDTWKVFLSFPSKRFLPVRASLAPTKYLSAWQQGALCKWHCAAHLVVFTGCYVVFMFVRGQVGALVCPDDRLSALMFPPSVSVMEANCLQLWTLLIFRQSLERFAQTQAR